jgi:hypothetical protein
MTELQRGGYRSEAGIMKYEFYVFAKFLLSFIYVFQQLTKQLFTDNGLIMVKV